MKNKLFSTKELVLIALFAAVIAISAWVAVPAAIPFTMQTFAVFFAVGTLGTRCGGAAVFVYILIGCTGFPVFAGPIGGIGALFSPNGGFILSFLPASLVCGLLSDRAKGFRRTALSMAAGLTVCYIIGSAYFAAISGLDAKSVIISCIIPYVIPDTVKILLAAALSQRIKKHV